MPICPCCKRPLAGLRSPLTGRFLAHEHAATYARDWRMSWRERVTVTALCAATVLPFIVLAAVL